MNVEVKPGQVWVDNDPRCKGRRRLIVDAVEGDRAVCRSYNDGAPPRKVKVKLARFRPGANGYTFLTDPAPPSAWETKEAR